MNIILLIGTLLGLTSVLMAAYADHGAAAYLSSLMLAKVLTAVRYHQLYAVIITILGVLISQQNNLQIRKWLVMTACVFISGVVLFCGGIYGALIIGMGGIIYLTPVGGMILMLGWLCFMRVAFIRPTRA